LIVYGRNPVLEILNYNSPSIKEIFLSRASSSKKFDEIVQTARKKGIKLSFVGKDKLNTLSDSSKHQGIAADIKEFQYVSFNDLLKRKEDVFYLILDHLEDPNNLGAIIRTSAFFSVDSVLLPKNRAVGVTPVVIKTSSGTVATTSICRVGSLKNVIDELKRNGFWIVGADASAEKAVYDLDIDGLKIALVIGNEGRGIGKGIKDRCDFLVSIPKIGNINSLNASVATGIMIYELTKLKGKGLEKNNNG